MVAAVVAIQGLPWLLIGLGVGVVVDRWDLRNAMAGAGIVQAVVVAALAVTVVVGVDSLPLLIMAAFVTSIGSTVRTIAAQTAIPRLVPPDDRDRANGRIEAGELIGNELVGPAAAGWMFGIASALPFAINAGASGVAILLLLSLPSVFRPLPVEATPALARSVLRDLHEGLSWLARQRMMRELVLAVAIVAMADAAWFAILVLYVTHTLHQGAGVYGVFLAVGALGGIAASSAGGLLRRVRPHIKLATAVAVMAGAQLVLGLTDHLVVASIMIACSSGAFAVFNITSMGMRQKIVPQRLLGRVTSAYLSIGAVAGAIGALVGGGLAASISIQAPMLVGVLPLLALAVALLVRLHPSTSDGLPNPIAS